MRPVLTAAHVRSAALLRVVQAFTLCNEMPAPTRRSINGQAKGIRLLVETNGAALAQARYELDTLQSAVKALDETEYGRWALTIDKYIEQLRRAL